MLRSKSTRFSTAATLRGRLARIVSSARSACTRRVISDPMTNTTPETRRRQDDGVGHREHRRRVDDHPVERTGGRFARKLFMRSEASSSDGLGGVRPAVITTRFGSDVR